MRTARDRTLLFIDMAFRPLGVTVAEAAEKAGCTHPVAERHLRTLAAQGYLNVSAKTPGRRQFGRPPNVFTAPFKIAFDKLPKGSVEFRGCKVFIKLSSLVQLTGGTMPTGVADP